MEQGSKNAGEKKKDDTTSLANCGNKDARVAHAKEVQVCLVAGWGGVVGGGGLDAFMLGNAVMSARHNEGVSLLACRAGWGGGHLVQKCSTVWSLETSALFSRMHSKGFLFLSGGWCRVVLASVSRR